MPRRSPTRVHDRRGRLVHSLPPRATQPETQVHVLDVHEIPLIESAHALPSMSRQQHAGPRHPIHDRRPITRSAFGVVPTGRRISRPQGTKKPVDRSRHNTGKRSTTRILGAVVIECTRPHAAHSRVCLSPLEKNAQRAGCQLCVRIQNEHPRCAALLQSLVYSYGEAAIRIVHDDRRTPLPRGFHAVIGREVVHHDDTHRDAFLAGERVNAGRKIRSTVVGHHDAVDLCRNRHGWRA